MEIEGLSLVRGPMVFVADCDIEFDLVNPKDDIYQPDGSPEFDQGQDEVNFRQVWVKSVMVRDQDGLWQSVNSETEGILCEMILDWCRDTPEIHIEAFKAAKKHK